MTLKHTPQIPIGILSPKMKAVQNGQLIHCDNRNLRFKDGSNGGDSLPSDEPREEK